MSVIIPLHTPGGSILYTETVLANIAGIAATENGGVFETNPNNLGDSISKILGKTDIKRGVEVLQGKQEGTIKITLHVHAVYGNNLLTVAKNIRSGVRSAIESMSGLKVEEIAVHIDGILGTESGSDQARLDKKD
jgi:uncharacterized alkaline shock family protein YloU